MVVRATRSSYSLTSPIRLSVRQFPTITKNSESTQSLATQRSQATSARTASCSHSKRRHCQTQVSTTTRTSKSRGANISRSLCTKPVPATKITCSRRTELSNISRRNQPLRWRAATRTPLYSTTRSKLLSKENPYAKSDELVAFAATTRARSRKLYHLKRRYTIKVIGPAKWKVDTLKRMFIHSDARDTDNAPIKTL